MSICLFTGFSPVEGYGKMIELLLQNGINEKEIRIMTAENPGQLLGVS